MKFLGLVAALAIPVLAIPGPISGEPTLASRDNVKFNQYRTLDDCYNDRDILYHAAPVSGQCINIDGQTGAMFINTAGFLASKLYSGGDCRDSSLGVSGGSCIARNQWNSFKLV